MSRTMSRRTVLGAMGGTAASAALLSFTAPTPARADNRTVAAPAQNRPPNIVLIMTDDQDVASLTAMPNVQRLVADQGTVFANSYASYPLCGPSRSSLLTGQYPHNHGVFNNQAYATLDGTETLPVWLGRAGYETAHIGKYLNGYEGNEVPPGWSEWYGAVGDSAYQMWGYTLNQNGTLVTYGQKDVEDPALYQTDVYARLATDYIARKAAGAPFFLSVAPLACHWEYGNPSGNLGPRPAPRHKEAFADQPLVIPPSFNEDDVSDKPAHIRSLPLLDDQGVEYIAQTHRTRLASLLAVDEAVAAIVNQLEASSELDTTLIVVTSDHGYFMGEHRIPSEKTHPYEEAAKIPLILRGPNLPKGAKLDVLASNIDLAPTFLAAARAQPEITVDGRSLISLANQPADRDLLIETDKYKAARTERHMYVEHSSGEQELYDMNNDPYQLQSLHADPAYSDQLADLAGRLHQLQSCAGTSC